jgi:uncharacterized membrane protein
MEKQSWGKEQKKAPKKSKKSRMSNEKVDSEDARADYSHNAAAVRFNSTVTTKRRRMIAMMMTVVTVVIAVIVVTVIVTIVGIASMRQLLCPEIVIMKMKKMR